MPPFCDDIMPVPQGPEAALRAMPLAALVDNVPHGVHQQVKQRAALQQQQPQQLLLQQQQPARAAAFTLDRPHQDPPEDLSYYAPRIHENLLRQERECEVCADYLPRQREITSKMRVILLDWLVDVHVKYRLRRETLFLMVDLVDRYLHKVSVPKSQLQLVGLCALLIAGKFEEVFPPDVREVVHVSANAYTPEQVLEMELHMLRIVGFKLTPPTRYHFLLRGLRCCKEELVPEVNRVVASAAHIAAECSIMVLVDCKPSMIAASALYIARGVCNVGWSPLMVQQLGYTEDELLHCVGLLWDRVMRLLRHPSKQEALKKKFRHTPYLEGVNAILGHTPAANIGPQMP